MASPALPAADVAACLARVLASRTFRGAERSRRLLQFIVEETLAGRGDRLKDYTLGAEGLGRGDGFDPRIDPIARVEASRLRGRLELYYASEGAADPVRITVPKGGYVATLEVIAAPPAPDPVAPAAEAAVPQVAGPAERRRPGLLGPVSLAVALAVAGTWAVLRLAPAPAQPEARVELVTPPTADPASLALAPDGRSIAVVATEGGVSRLCLRALAEAACRPLAGTEFATQPFWSPDGRTLGFFVDARVRTIDLGTGVVRTVSTAPVPAGGAWGGRGDIIHPVVPDSPIFRLRQDGSLVPATALAPGQSGHHGPSFLPDGRRFLFYAAGDAAARGVYLAELGSPGATRLVDADGPAVFAAPAHLIYVQNATLFVQAFDLTRGRPAGAPVRLADHVMADSVTGPPPVTASADGTLAYRTGPVAPRRQFVWFDRQGRELARVGDAEERGPAYGSMAPDGRRLAIQRTTAGNTDIWIVDLERGPAVRFTTAPQADIAPAWSPRGDRIAFASQVSGVFELFERGLDEPAPRLLLRTGEAKQITDWSRDGRRLLFRTVTTGPGGDMNVWALTLDGGSAPVAVVRTPFEERDAQFSPDGRWIAFQSNDSGRPEIYVQPFPGPGERMRISTGGGVQVRWRADGRELFYLTPDGRLHAVAIALPAAAGRPHAGTPVPLFAARTGATQGSALASYIPAPDGQRFLVDQVIEQQPAPIALILDWHRP